MAFSGIRIRLRGEWGWAGIARAGLDFIMIQYRNLNDCIRGRPSELRLGLRFFLFPKGRGPSISSRQIEWFG